MYVYEIVRRHCAKIDVFEFKQSFKVWKVVIPRFICACSIILQHIKNQMKNKKFSLSDLMLVVVEGIFLLSTIENICIWGDLTYKRTHD
jgi:hypothetical protein